MTRNLMSAVFMQGMATEGAVKELALEARQKCKVCGEPTQVTIRPVGTFQ